jgi:hypothetical protein
MIYPACLTIEANSRRSKAEDDQQDQLLKGGEK